MSSLWQTYRWHPADSWRTEMVLIRDGVEYPITPPSKYAKHSIEDGRLFWYRGIPHISMTIAKSHVLGQKFDPCICGYGKIGPEGHITDWVEPEHKDNVWSKQTKNLVFFECAGKLYCVWEISPNQTVYELNVGKIVNEFKTTCPPCSFGQPRGGTPPLPFGEGKSIRFFHANRRNPKSDVWWNYSLGCLIMQSRPPFKILQISKQPILSGDELYYPGHKHWKPKCLLPYGAIEQDGGWLVAMGKNDSAAVTALIKEGDLNL